MVASSASIQPGDCHEQCRAGRVVLFVPDGESDRTVSIATIRYCCQGRGGGVINDTRKTSDIRSRRGWGHGSQKSCDGVREAEQHVQE